MSKIEKIITSALVALTIVVLFVIFTGLTVQKVDLNQIPVNLGSAEDDSYNYKLIDSSNASSTDLVVVRGGSVTFAFITVTATSSVALSLYDAVTSTATAEKIATLPANISPGTYQFRIALRKGLAVLGGAGFDGIYTISYK